MKASCYLAAAALLGASLAHAAPLLGPTDFVIAIDTDVVAPNSQTQGGEEVNKVIDGNTGSKYLNPGMSGSGFIVTPGPSIVQSFQLNTANDGPERDPAQFKLFGTNDSILSTNNSTGTGESWTLIAKGGLTLPTVRNTPGPIVNVTNSTSFSSYKLFFPTLRDDRAACCMQVAEAQFFAGLNGAGGSILAPANPIIAIDTPTSASVYPDAERPSRALDNNITTKYLNFGRENTGLIVTPSIGASIADSLQITTGNDSPERDVSVFSVFGTNAAINSMDNSLGDEEVWTLLADHLAYASPDTRDTPGPIVAFTNTIPYTSYKIVFNDNKGPDSANSIQLDEVQLFGGVGVPEPTTLSLAFAGIVGLALRRRRA